MNNALKDELNLVGRVVSHYKILEQLGEGGMGVVYVAEDTRLGRRAALKFLPKSLTRDDDARRRFVHEAQAASSLDDQNICTVYEIDEVEDGGTFIAMAYCEGENLRELISRGPVPVERAVGIALQIAEGLEKAHRRGIIHRDIKPANVILMEGDLVKIVDFGLAKLTGRTQITRTGATLGTAGYMAPEQVRGETMDRRADIWSVGVVLYEMLAGRTAFSGEYEQAIFYQIVHEEPDWTVLPREVAPIVRKCMQKDPSKRYDRMSELAEALSALITPQTAVLPAARRFASQWTRPAFAIPVLAAVVLLAALLSPVNRTAIFSSLGISTLPEARHLAVLPFRNVNGDAAGDAYCSGLMETLTSKLTHLEQFSGERFWVVPASDVLSRSVKSAADARKVFGANLVIDGSFTRQAETVRLTLNLIDADTGRMLASEIIDPPSTDAIALQDAAIIRVAEMLRVEMPPGAGRMLRAGGTFVPGAEEFYLQGRGYLNDYQKAENVETAIGLFERALEEDSTYALAHAGLAEAYWRKYRAANDVQWVDRAVRHGERALALDEMLAPAHVMLGTSHIELGRYDEALKAFQLASEIDPLNADAYRGRAKAYEAEGRVAEAEETLKKAISLRPSYWAGYNELGVFYYRHGRYDDAVEQFKTVAALTPENSRIYRNLGGVYFAQGRNEAAAEMFRRSVEIEPDYAVYSNLATLNFYEGRYRESARMYEAALELNNSDYRVWGYLAEARFWAEGMIAETRAAYAEAIRRANEILRINPHDAEALSSVAGYYARLGQRGRATRSLDKLIALNPEDLKVLFKIGGTYEQLGQREEALKWIDRAIRNGYTTAEVERAPSLRALRADPRYQQIKNNALTN